MACYLLNKGDLMDDSTLNNKKGSALLIGSMIREARGNGWGTMRITSPQKG